MFLFQSAGGIDTEEAYPYLEVHWKKTDPKHKCSFRKDKVGAKVTGMLCYVLIVNIETHQQRNIFLCLFNENLWILIFEFMYKW